MNILSDFIKNSDLADCGSWKVVLDRIFLFYPKITRGSYSERISDRVRVSEYQHAPGLCNKLRLNQLWFFKIKTLTKMHIKYSRVFSRLENWLGSCRLEGLLWDSFEISKERDVGVILRKFCEDKNLKFLRS